MPNIRPYAATPNSYPFPTLNEIPTDSVASDRQPSLMRSILGASLLTITALFFLGIGPRDLMLTPWFGVAGAACLCGGCGVYALSLRKNKYVEMAIRHRQERAERPPVRRAA